MTRSTVTGRTPTNDENAPTPTDVTMPDGQKADHWVMSPEERAKGHVRPVRLEYEHVGVPGPQYPLLDLTDHQKSVFGNEFVKFEKFPDSEQAVGRYWTQKELNNIGNGCGCVTRMPLACAETYAAKPGYYGATFCVGCGDYFPVGKRGEFVWKGTNERVGT